MSSATQMRPTRLALAAALVLAAPAAPAAASVRDFRLPPDPSQTQPAPDQQGPVAPDVPESRRPAAAPAPTPTPTPAASRPAPAPTVTPPRVVLPSATSAPQADGRRTPASRPATLPAATPSAPVADTAAPEPNPVEGLGIPSSASQTPPAAPAAVDALQPADDGGSTWPWLLAVLLGAAGAGGTAWTVWRRRQRRGALAVPRIERPRLARAPVQPSPDEPPAAMPGEPLQVSLEPLRLSLTLINATLAYRLQVANRGTAPLTGLAIGADMIAAHASMTREEQLSGPGSGAPAQRIERLEPGESRVVEGEFRVPFSQIVPIRQGNAALLLPLARFRVEADGARPVVRTFAVGQPGAGSALQPFRLDQGPRVYPKLAQHAFA
ncbi:MAG TPA: hypothetical protein VEB68_13895 [Croceibacterium sp.]|nr:hypothetical protein [Croceibacterium sp.]